MKDKIVVRPAELSDRKQIFEFCEQTWEWGDYIPEVWQSWLQQPNGKLFVATINKTPVGIGHVAITKPGEAWLEGARTHPSHRRKGVATAIAKASLQFAIQKGAKTARLATESNNTAAKIVLKKLGFKPVSEFVKTVCENMSDGKSLKSRLAETKDEENLWKYLQTSECFKKSAGLFTKLFTWFSLGKPELKNFLKKRKAILYEEKGLISGLTLVEDGVSMVWNEESIQTCYISGSRNAVVDMIRLLKQQCRESKISKIYGFACNYEPVTSALLQTGFKPHGSSEIIYEKTLK